MDQSKQLNERITEEILERSFNKNGFVVEGVNIERQKSKNPIIRKLLKHASKGGRGNGAPEHIITLDGYPEFVIVTECKSDIKLHESENMDKPKMHAVDGVIHYMQYLAKEYNVIGIAVSGMTENELRVSNFFLGKGLSSVQLTRLPDEKVLNLEDYLSIFKANPHLKKQKALDLMKFSKTLHNFMRDYAKLAENEKPLLVSAILLALEDPAFQTGYALKANDQKLSSFILTTISDILESNNIEEKKKLKIENTFSFIKTHPELTKTTTDIYNRVLLRLVQQIDEHILPFIRDYHDLDVVGNFYGEFLRYTGGDKKALGIVLTPNHITELFAELAELTTESKVLDPCAGTGGFLISCANKMIELAHNDGEVIKKIKKNGLIGVEQQPNMFTLGCSNLLLREYGMKHFYQDNCFEIKSLLSSLQADVGTINPPYAQKGEGLSELEYIEFLLDCIKKDGKVFAIVPISCAIINSPVKKRLLEKHTLEAVMSMSNDLFYPVGTYTCIMVFTAKKPHSSNKETWFAYWKDDGFEKTKSNGRIDLNNRWEQIKSEWVNMYINRDVVIGTSVKKKVGASDEWCAEAYLETDYSTLNQTDFENEMERFVSFKMTNKERLY